MRGAGGLGTLFEGHLLFSSKILFRANFNNYYIFRQRCWRTPNRRNPLRLWLVVPRKQNVPVNSISLNGNNISSLEVLLILPHTRKIIAFMPAIRILKMSTLSFQRSEKLPNSDRSRLVKWSARLHSGPARNRLCQLRNRFWWQVCANWKESRGTRRKTHVPRGTHAMLKDNLVRQPVLTILQSEVSEPFYLLLNKTMHFEVF